MKTIKSILTFAIALIIVALGGALPAQTAQTYQLKNVTAPTAATLDNVTFPAGLIVGGTFTAPSGGAMGDFKYTVLSESDAGNWHLERVPFTIAVTDPRGGQTSSFGIGTDMGETVFSILGGEEGGIYYNNQRVMRFSPGNQEVNWGATNVDFGGNLSCYWFDDTNPWAIPNLEVLTATGSNGLTATQTTQGVIFYASGTAPPTGTAPEGAIYIQYQ